MTDPEDAELRRLLYTDALAEAEKITGKSYKDDEKTSRIGMALHMALNAAKTAALQEAADSHLGMNLDETLRLFYMMGFDEVLCDEFTARSSQPGINETYRLLWRQDGLLATVESYAGIRLNMSKVYYNIEFPRGSHTVMDVLSSGKMWSDDWDSPEGRRVWIGDHDAREGIRYRLRRLEEVGTFLPVWVEQPFLWFVTHEETKDADYDYKEITNERISRLPENIQYAIRGTLDES